jgi:hypothetical protein
MYSTCIYCKKPLGRNQTIESFPVGRRLAFDPDKGRLWVVCRHCERWNLSPLEERWEAFEECERLFRATRLRMSTDEVGLARVGDGLDLVRIGAPLRPEFAAWRYGDQFGRRRQRAIIYTGAGVALFSGLLIGASVAGIGAGGFWGFWNVVVNLPTRAKLKTKDGRVLKVKHGHLQSARLYRDPDGSWLATLKVKRREIFTGAEAERAAAVLLPAINLMAGSRDAVRRAVGAIEEAGDPEAFLAKASAGLPPSSAIGDKRARKQARFSSLAVPTRLALEMALHEERERRALAGELVELELAWREAEEIAAIADNLLVPKPIEDFVERHRPH